MIKQSDATGTDALHEEEVSPVNTHPEEEERRSGTADGTRSGSATQPLPQSQGAPVDDQHAVQRLQQEVAALHAQLDTRGRRQRRITRLRQIVAAFLVVIAALGVTASVIGVWGARTALDTDRWVATVTPLDQDPAVRAAVSATLTDQIFGTLNVQQRVQEALPPRAAFLATPLTGQVRTYVQDSVNKVIASPQFAQLWVEMNRVAHKQVVAILEGDSTVVRSSGDTVTLNLLPVVNEVLRLLEQQVPTLFGRTVDLPTITNGQIPAGLQTRIESALGVTLPANFAEIPIYRGDELSMAQQAVVQVKRSLGLLVLGSVLSLALAFLISPNRRRTTLQLGVWLAVSVVALTGLLRAIRAQLVEQVSAGQLRDGVDAAVQVVFAPLRERGTQLLWLGVLIALVAYLVGPGRAPVALRHGVAQGAHLLSRRARRYAAVAVADGPGFARAHRDPLRIGGAVVAGVLLLFFTSWTGLLLIAVALGLYELLVTAVAGADHEPTGEPVNPPRRDAGQPSRSSVSTA
ncbi:MAG: hypothetical protein M3537_03095 [Chloroflexota bacterium]|nr:hypothetical protein [Chloroflexota bacterium]